MNYKPKSEHKRFASLGKLLKQSEVFWRPIPFHQKHIDWVDMHPQLAQRLFSLPRSDLEYFTRNIEAFIACFSAEILASIPQYSEIQSLSQLPSISPQELPTVSPHFHTGIAGRKWTQIQQFSHAMKNTSLPVLEWCAGKSHLGFYLNHMYELPVTALEWNQNLVTQANAKARSHRYNLHSQHVDVLKALDIPEMNNHTQVVALHACGELHERLLSLCSEKEVPHLSLAPCCYHKRSEEVYTPFSDIGKAIDLNLEKIHLHTAVMDSATSRAGVMEQRKALQIMRLGFDEMQRDLLQGETFLPVPSLPMSWSKVSFNTFCDHCAKLKGLRLPDKVDWSLYLHAGEARFAQVSALDLVRLLFKRPLELWLNLDKVVWLQDQGYHTDIGTFCDYQTSPRNILIRAHKS